MSGDLIAGGDTAEYTGRAKGLRGAHVEVVGVGAARVAVVARKADAYVVRFVKMENLKRLGGGVLDDALE